MAVELLQCAWVRRNDWTYGAGPLSSSVVPFERANVATALDVA